MLKKFKVTVLMGTPTYLLHLARVAEDIGIDASAIGLRLVMTTGESGSASVPNTGVRLAKAYGCKIHDFAGTQETNYFFGTCNNDIPHLNEDLIYFEVLDPDTLEPVKPGEEGTLVITDLVQKTHPMIRFKSGDIIKGIDYDYKCSCGRTQARFKGFMGRVGDTIKIKGICVSVAGIENVIRGIRECSDNYEYEAVKDGEKDKIVVRVEPVKELPPSEWGKLKRSMSEIMRESFMINMDIEIVPPGTLPVYDMKAKRFKDLRV
jgi:phenylacetate-CoA ligase